LGIPGIGLVIDGAVQQAPHCARQEKEGGGKFMVDDLEGPKVYMHTGPSAHPRQALLNILSPLQQWLDAVMNASLYWLFLR